METDPRRPERDPKVVRIERDRRIWELAAEGMAQRQIAETVEAEGLGGLSQQAVAKSIARSEKKILERMKSQAEPMKARQTEQVRYIFRQAMAEWHRSKGPGRVVRRQTLPSRLSGNTGRASLADLIESESAAERPARQESTEERVTSEIREQCGDPAYLGTALAALDREAKIWGLYAPQKREMSGRDGGPIEVVETTDEDRATREKLKRLTLEQRLQYRELLTLMESASEDEGGDDGGTDAGVP